jgi:hypothetical protein
MGSGLRGPKVTEPVAFVEDRKNTNTSTSTNVSVDVDSLEVVKVPSRNGQNPSTSPGLTTMERGFAPTASASSLSAHWVEILQWQVERKEAPKQES